MQSTEWTQYNKDRVVTDDSDGVYPVYQLGWFPDYSDPDNSCPRSSAMVTS